MKQTMLEMNMKLLTMNSCTRMSATQDGISLLKTIRNICHKNDGGTNATTILNLVRMDKDMYLIHQAPTKLPSSYLSKFKGVVDVVELSNGYLWSHLAATKIVFNDLYTPTEYQEAAVEAQRCYLSALILHGLSTRPTGN
jgi:hypothetical protein